MISEASSTKIRSRTKSTARPRPPSKASDALLILRLARDPPAGPRTYCSCSASPEVGLVPHPRRLRLNRPSGRLSHPFNAFGRIRYVSEDGTVVEASAGDHLLIEPGHLAEVVGDEPCIVLDW